MKLTDSQKFIMTLLKSFARIGIPDTPLPRQIRSDKKVKQLMDRTRTKRTESCSEQTLVDRCEPTLNYWFLVELLHRFQRETTIHEQIILQSWRQDGSSVGKS